MSIRRSPTRAISSSANSSPLSSPAGVLSTTFNIGSVSFHRALTGVRVVYAEGYAAFFIPAPDPQLSVITQVRPSSCVPLTSTYSLSPSRVWHRKLLGFGGLFASGFQLLSRQDLPRPSIELFPIALPKKGFPRKPAA